MYSRARNAKCRVIYPYLIPSLPAFLIQINTNGVISFLVEVSGFTPDAFPLGGNKRLVAPFWADVDATVAGQVFYRETSDPGLLQQATNDVTATYVDHKKFRATWLLIATWYEVAFFGAAGIYRDNVSAGKNMLHLNFI